MFFERLKEQIEKNTDFDIKRIQKAYDFAKSIHGHQTRKTGEPFITHPVEVASILCKTGATEDMICVALLHDVIENKDQHDFSRDFLVQEFDEKVVKLIEILSKLKSWQTPYCRMKSNLTDLENNFIEYPEAIIVKMADRIHNLQTIHGFEKEKQQEYLEETEKFLMPIFKKAMQKVQKKEYQNIMHQLIEKLKFEFKLKKGRSIKEKNKEKETLQIIKYESWSGIKHVYEEVLKEAIRTGEEILAFEMNQEFFSQKFHLDEEKFTEEYIKRRMKHKVKAMIICPETKQDKLYKKKYESAYTKVKLIPEHLTENMEVNINIVGDLITTFYLNPELGTLRKDRREANSWKSFFYLLWNQY